MSAKEYLSFTKRERTGIMALVAVLLIVAVLPHFIQRPAPPPETVPVAALERKSSYYDSSEFSNHEGLQTGHYQNRYPDRKYYPEYNYNTGNHYRKQWYASNYKKRYYNDSAYHRKPVDGDNYYRNNFGEGRSYSHIDKSKIYRAYTTNYATHYRPSPAPIDINTADTTALIALPGIGSKLAGRIVSFRDKLGGFNSVNQISEVYGLRDSVFQILLPYLKCDSVYVRKPLLTYNTLR